MDFSETFIWDYLKRTKLPILLYGTGNGAEKIIKTSRKYGVEIKGVFSSDGFSKKRDFCGYNVQGFSDIKEQYSEFITLLGFAAGNKELIDYVKTIASQSAEFYVPEVPVFGEDIFTPEILEKNKKRIAELYDALQDDKSKATLQKLIKYKISGKPSYLYDMESERQEVFENILHLGNKETFLDLGAFTGDTIEEFLGVTDSKYEKIIAVEPAPKNFQRLKDFAARNNIKNIELIEAAVSSSLGVAYFSEKGGRNPFLQEIGKYTVKTVTLDSFNLKPTYIKFDVEGAEMAAISGGEKTITSNIPKLAISLYHKTMDFLDIPLYIKRLVPQYKLYLRHHPYLPAWETNLYATL